MKENTQGSLFCYKYGNGKAKSVAYDVMKYIDTYLPKDIFY